MRHAYFTSEIQTSYPVAVLVPTIRASEISECYLEKGYVSTKETIILDLYTAPGKKKTPVSEIKEYIVEELEPTLTDLQVEYVLCAHADYFKALTGAKKVDASLGYVLNSLYGNFKVIYIPSYRARFYDPEKIDAQIDQALMALATYRNGCYVDPGTGIIQFSEYPSTIQDISNWLDRLISMNCPLTIDTENFSLKHHDAGLGTISFAWNQHEGIAFAVDYVPIPGATEAPYGIQLRNEPIRRLLRSFFKRLMQKTIYHNISYDVYVMIYQLFMDDITDTEGLLEGLEVMLKNWDCTKLITYLATNSCAGNKLGLKEQSQEFAGNYAEEEIKDIKRIRLPDLLKYNLVDSLSTWYTYNKHHQTMINDQQEDFYDEIFRPAIKDIIQMQLTGLPINIKRVAEVRVLLEADSQSAIDRMQNSAIVKEYTDWLNRKWVFEKNEKLKKKRVTIADANETFNPNSNPQLQELLYEQLNFPVIATTDSGAPSADGDTLKALKHHTTDVEVLALLDALIDHKAVDKILTSFIPAFECAVQGPDGWHYLFGNFNLGGTLSARLSSSKPNLQNLPASSRYAKLIKECVEAPPGWLFVGLDFDSLEDKISGLTTRDPNKLKVYCGHIVYALEIDGSVHHIRDDATIIYDGAEYTGADFYDKFAT